MSTDSTSGVRIARSLNMKIILFVLAVLAATVCVHGIDKRVDDCEIELGFQGKIVSLETYRTYYPCILACFHEKLGVMVDSKLLPEKYVSDYVQPRYVDYGEFYKPKLLECIIEANNQTDKCDLERSLEKCMFANWKTIFPHDDY